MSPLSRRLFIAAISPLGLVTHARPWGEKLSSVPPDLDHILLGVNDLDAGVDWFFQRSGVRAALGGVHPGRGTRNALLAVGPRRYLEIIAPDPAQAGKSQFQDDRIAEFRGLKEPRLIGWAAHTNDISGIVKRANAAGLKIEGPADGSRSRPNGKLLRWKTVSLENNFDNILPFFIEWNSASPHPSVDAPTGCKLIHFSAQSPKASQAARVAKLLKLGLVIASGTAPRLKATIIGSKNELELL